MIGNNDEQETESIKQFNCYFVLMFVVIIY